ALARRLQELGWLASAPVIQPLPVALDRWPALPPPATDRPVVLVVGRLEPRKGQALAVEAVARLRAGGIDAAVHLLGDDTELPGGGSSAEQLRRRAGELEVELTIEPSREADGVRRAVAQATVVAVPSGFESFSMVAAEALASGRPVVCAPL